MQIQITMKCHYTHVRMAKIKNKKQQLTISSAGDSVEILELSCNDGGNTKQRITLENSLEDYHKNKHILRLSDKD